MKCNFDLTQLDPILSTCFHTWGWKEHESWRLPGLRLVSPIGVYEWDEAISRLLIVPHGFACGKDHGLWSG